MKVLHQNCDPSLAEDRSLPYTAYLVEYEIDGAKCFDIVIPHNKIEIFDYYWDRYREGLKRFKQTEGRSNPKLWSANSDSKKSNKK